MVWKTLFLAYLFHFIPSTHGWSEVTSRPVEEPEPVLLSLEDMYNGRDTFRLNDPEEGLTALMDKKLSSCFVNDYDPYWLPGPSDKSYIIKNQPCDKVNKNTDLTTLKKKAGPKIAYMCKELYVFWLAARSMAPPPLPGMFPQQQARLCPYGDGETFQSRNSQVQMITDRVTPVSHEVAPPMLGERTQATFQGSGSPVSRNGAPPLTDDDAPPMMYNRAPPMIDDSEPPMVQNRAPPMSLEGVPPRLDNGAPPMLHERAPPMSHEEEPPMMRDAIPPMHGGPPPKLQDGAPPMIKEGEMQPPLAINSHSRRDLDPPPTAKQQPPSLAAILKNMMKKNKEANIVAPPTPDMRTPSPPIRFRRKL